MEENRYIKEKVFFLASMIIFATIGAVRRYITMPSGFVAAVRGLSGALFLLAAVLITGRSTGGLRDKKTLFLLIFSGTVMGINWVLLFESYNYTTVAVATLCYYMAPVFYMIAGRVFFGERFTVKKLICAAAAAAGMVFVTGGAAGENASSKNLTGIVLGLAAAFFYAMVMVLNKKTAGQEPYGKTVIQLFTAAAVAFVYTAFFEKVSLGDLTLQNALLLLLMGFLHTGLAYLLYFSSLQKLPAHTAAFLCYIDPVAVLFISVLFLHEKLTLPAFAGAVLIIGAAAVSSTNGIKQVKE